MLVEDKLLLFRLLCFSFYTLHCKFYFTIGIVGYHAKAVSELFVTSKRATEEEVLKKVDAYVKTLHKSAEICEEDGVMICSVLCAISF